MCRHCCFHRISHLFIISQRQIVFPVTVQIMKVMLICTRSPWLLGKYVSVWSTELQLCKYSDWQTYIICHSKLHNPVQTLALQYQSSKRQETLLPAHKCCRKDHSDWGTGWYFHSLCIKWTWPDVYFWQPHIQRSTFKLLCSNSPPCFLVNSFVIHLEFVMWTSAFRQVQLVDNTKQRKSI